MDPGSLAASTTYVDMPAFERRADRARNLLDRLNAGVAFELTADEVGETTDAVHELVEELADAAKEDRRARAEGDVLRPGRTELAELFRAVAPRLIGATSRRRLRATFGDRQAIPVEHVWRWRLLFEQLVRVRDEQIASAWVTRLKNEEVYRRHQAPVVRRLPTLRLVEEYETRVRRGIERATAMLLGLIRRRESAGSGSFIENASAGLREL